MQAEEKHSLAPPRETHRRKFNLTRQKNSSEILRLAAPLGCLGVMHSSVRCQGRGKLTVTSWQPTDWSEKKCNILGGLEAGVGAVLD